MTIEIDAPFSVSVVQQQDDSSAHELQLTFTPEFQQLDRVTQGGRISAYVADLRQQAQGVPADSREQQGMLTVIQIAEQLVPLVQAGELDLEQDIIAELTPADVDEEKPITH